jgi:hypothetical protein
MAGILRVPRSRGGFSGLLLIVLGLWGGLAAFAGPAFRYGYGPAAAWTMTSGRLYLEMLPAIGAVLGGLIVLGSRIRPMATAGACLAAASGAWFAVGSTVTATWAPKLVPDPGVPLGGSVARAAEQIGMFTGLGVAIVFFAALALGRFTVIAVRDAAIAGRNAVPATVEPVPAASAAAVGAPVEAAERVGDEPAHDGPVVARPVVAKPVVARPVVAEPVTAEPVTAEPAPAQEVPGHEPVAGRAGLAGTGTATAATDDAPADRAMSGSAAP